MYIQEDDLKLNDWQFSQRKYLPYETKLRLTETRIREWHYNWDGQVYLSYSAGLDSTVLLHMIRKILGNDVPAVFSNTGLEFPEIVRFARKAQGEFIEIYPRGKDGKRNSKWDAEEVAGKAYQNQLGYWYMRNAIAGALTVVASWSIRICKLTM